MSENGKQSPIVARIVLTLDATGRIRVELDSAPEAGPPAIILAGLNAHFPMALQRHMNALAKKNEKPGLILPPINPHPLRGD